MAAKLYYIYGERNASSNRVEYCRLMLNDYSDINMERNVGYNIVYLQMNCSKTKEKTAEQTCTGSSLCIKVHNGGLVAAPGEL